jgi:NAD(P)-dependent dehydrogenase (short-subunit alcohol dehydrogenase family)
MDQSNPFYPIYSAMEASDNAMHCKLPELFMKRDRSFTWSPPEILGTAIANRSVAIIGGTGGIGRALSRHFAALGARVTVVGQTFRDAGLPGIDFIQADLSLMRESGRVAEALQAEELDLVIFTTGIFAAPQRQETAEGIERDLAVSYLNRLVILRAIAPRLGLKSARRPRVFVMGYPGSGQRGNAEDLNAERSYKAMSVHMNTVAGNEMLVLDAARRYPDIDVFGLNPGLIKTNIRDNFFGKDTLKSRLMEWMIGMLTPTGDEYARRITPLLLSPDLTGRSGIMFNNKAEAIHTSTGLNQEYVRQFMAASEALIGRTKGNRHEQTV